MNRWCDYIINQIESTKMSKSSSFSGSLRLILAVLAVLTVLAGLIAKFELIPTIACKIGLKITECGDNETKLVELLVLSETGEPLANVSVEAKGSSGAPEIAYTDAKGFVHINIPSKGDVDVFLKDKNYPIEKFTINLLNSESTTREIRLKHDGTPIVSNTINNPSPVPVSAPSTSTPILTENLAPKKISLLDGATWTLPISDKSRTLAIKLRITAYLSRSTNTHATFELLNGQNDVGACSVSSSNNIGAINGGTVNECTIPYDVPANKTVIFSAKITPTNETAPSPSPGTPFYNVSVAEASIVSIYAK